MSGSKRIQLIDILRGVAMFGVILINFYEMNLLPGMESHIECSSRVMDLIYALFYNRAYLIFAFLFGYNLHILQTNLQYKNPKQQNRVIYQRLLSIFVLGVIQTIVLWWGTILILYAIYGLLVYVCFVNLLKRQNYWCYILPLFVLIIIPTLLLILQSYYFASTKLIAGFHVIDLAEVRGYYQSGNLVNILLTNLWAWLYDYFGIGGGYFDVATIIASINYNCQILGLILFGYVLAQKQFLNSLTLKKVIYYLLILSVLWLSIIVLGYTIKIKFLFIKNLIFSAMMVLILAQVSQSRLVKLVSWLGVVGKTSFSFYVMHMIVAYVLFYVCNLYQQFDFSHIEFMALGTFFLLFILNGVLLKRGRNGIFENLLKRLTYLGIK